MDRRKVLIGIKLFQIFIFLFGCFVNISVARSILDVIRPCYRNSAPIRKQERRLNLSPSIRYTEKTPVISIDSVVDEIDMQQILVLSKCIEELYPGHFEDRHFNLGKTGKMFFPLLLLCFLHNRSANMK